MEEIENNNHNGVRAATVIKETNLSINNGNKKKQNVMVSQPLVAIASIIVE